MENTELVVSINDIGEYSGVSTKAIIRAIRNNSDKFALMGLRLDSELSHLHTVLNEPEATFLMTLLKNTPTVSEFKFNLVMQFYKMKEQVCEVNKLEVESLTKQLEIARDLKTYKDGYVSLRKYIKDNDKFIKEDVAWSFLTDNGYVENVYPQVLKRNLLDTTIGRQKDGKSPEFSPSDLDRIFKGFRND